MTENLTDAELDALEAEVRIQATRIGGYRWQEVLRALAELREWRAQFGTDPSRWHKVWEVGPMRVGPLCPEHPAATQGNPYAQEAWCGECDWNARPDR